MPRKTQAKPTAVQAVKIAPGYIVINASEAGGGVTYDREVLHDQTGQQTRSIEFVTLKTIDHEALVSQINAAVKDVDHTLRKLCARTPFGHFTPVKGLAAIRADVAMIATRLDDLNAQAAAAGSRHRGRAAVVAAYLDVNQPENLRECYRTIRGVLTEVYEALRAGDVSDDKDSSGAITRRHQLRPIMLRAKNLDTMAVGLPGVAIRSALDRVKMAKHEILKMITPVGKGGQGMTPAEAGAAVDLTEVMTAIHWFSNEG